MRQKKRNLALIVMANVLFFALFFIKFGYAGEIGRPLTPKDIRENIYGSAVLSDTEFLMVGDRGKIYRSVDRGKIWREISSGTKQPLFSVSFLDPKTGWISGKSGLILHTTDGGITWSRQESGTKKHLFSIHFWDVRHGCAVGDWGAVVFTEDGGAIWQDGSLKEDVILYGVRFAASQRAWAVGEFGRIFSTIDGGRRWTPIATLISGEKSLFCLNIEGESLLAAGLDGIIIYSKDGGKSWHRARCEVERSLYSIGVRRSTGWAGGDSGVFLSTGDGGESWQMVDVPEKNRLSWVGTIALRDSNSGESVGFGAGGHGLFFTIIQQKIKW